MPSFFFRCWSMYPALLYGLFMFLGASLAIFDVKWPVLFLLALLLFFPAINILPAAQHGSLRILLATSLGIMTFFFTNYYYQIPNVSQLNGKAEISFSSVIHSKTPFGLLWTYKGTLHSFIPSNASQENKIFKNLPISISLPSKSNISRPSADYRYLLQARFKEVNQGRYALSLTKGANWEPVAMVWNLAEWRFKAKTVLRKTIYSAIKDTHAAAFLAGIATGEFDDRQLSFELGRFGLQHLMAISGLHFAIIASIIGLILQLLLPHKLSTYLLIIILSAYFLFLGLSPSVVRAWTMITITLVGMMIGKRSLALNSLGVALIMMALLDPFAAQNIGFQFSFAITAAILVWFAPCERICQKIFAKRKLSEIAEMGIFSQHGYCLLYFLKQALALAIAVNIVALPMTLYHFHKFPLMSFVYNLFFPFLMSISMVLLIAGLSASILFPWLADHIHIINEHFTQYLLSFAFNLPKSFDIAIRIDWLSKECLMIYLIFTYAIGLWTKCSIDKNAPFVDI